MKIPEEFINEIQELIAKYNLDVEIEIIAKDKQRTNKQNRANHLWFTQIANTFNEAGLDVKVVLQKKLDHPWDGKLVKEFIWRPAQKSMFGKKSSKSLTSKENCEVSEVINRWLGENFGIHIPFPSVENAIDYSKDKTT